jgi:DnaJ-class molecular chaperone
MAERDWQAEIAALQERDRKARRLLGVSETADAQAIRQAFRQASLAHHPDRNDGDPSADRRFHLVCSAYKFLTEGEACDALDAFDPDAADASAGEQEGTGDNPWGYWCWWRKNYFDGP